MSVPFLTTSPGAEDHLLAVEVAWGADLTDLAGTSWTWDDISDYVVLTPGEGGEEQGISVVIGRPDFSSETQAADLQLLLDNRDGRFSGGGLSPYWPNVRRGTPVRVQVSADGGDTWQLRFQGGAASWVPQWDPITGRWATVALTASGPLRKLNQGTGLHVSAMRDGTLADSSVVAYWPCEDEWQADYFAPAVGSSVGTFSAWDPETETEIPAPAAEFASYGDIPSSGPFLVAVNGGDIDFPVPDAATSSASTVTGLFGNITSLTPYDGTTLDDRGFTVVGNVFDVFTVDAAKVKAYSINYQTNTSVTPHTTGILEIKGHTTHPFEHTGPTDFSNRVTFDIRDQTPYEIGLSLSQSGSTTTWRVFVREIGQEAGSSFGGTVSSNSNGAKVTAVAAAGFETSAGLAVGHLVVRNQVITAGYDMEWSNGHLYESPQQRIERLCTNHGIHFVNLGTPIVANSSVVDDMGPQYYDTLTALLRECERTGQGVLFDGLGPGLSFVTKRRREANAGNPATLVLDAAQGHIMEPFAPVDDDQLLINRCDVTRRGGTSTTYSDLTGPEGVQTVGEYATSLTVNPWTDEGLWHYAEWIVGLGTQTGYRYPSVSFALETNPELIAGWLACIPTSRIDIENITAIRRQHAPETIKLLIEGWQETITAFTWRVTANTSAAAPWNVIRAAAATGDTGDDIAHYDTDSSQLAADAAAGATSISVRTNSGPRWVVPGDTAEGGADNFPFDLDVGGCKVTVTSISGTSTSGQTFTLAAPGLPRAMTGSATPGAGTPVKVWQPPVLGL